MPRGNTVVSDVLSASTQLFLLYALIGVYDGHGILSAVHVHLGQEAGGSGWPIRSVGSNGLEARKE